MVGGCLAIVFWQKNVPELVSRGCLAMRGGCLAKVWGCLAKRGFLAQGGRLAKNNTVTGDSS